MTTLYVVQNTTDEMAQGDEPVIDHQAELAQGDEPVIDHQAELASRRFACHLFIRTLHDAQDFVEWRETREYKNRFFHQFGFSKSTPQRGAIEYVRACMHEWVSSEKFRWFCRVLEFDFDYTRTFILEAMDGKNKEQIATLLTNFREELTFYARRGPKPKKTKHQKESRRKRPGA